MLLTVITQTGLDMHLIGVLQAAEWWRWAHLLCIFILQLWGCLCVCVCAYMCMQTPALSSLCSAQVFGIIFTICQGKIIDHFGTLAGNIFLCVFLLIGAVMTGKAFLNKETHSKLLVLSHTHQCIWMIFVSFGSEFTISLVNTVQECRWQLLHNVKDSLKVMLWYTECFQQMCLSLHSLEETCHILTGNSFEQGEGSGF